MKIHKLHTELRCDNLSIHQGRPEASQSLVIKLIKLVDLKAKAIHRAVVLLPRNKIPPRTADSKMLTKQTFLPYTLELRSRGISSNKCNVLNHLTRSNKCHVVNPTPCTIPVTNRLGSQEILRSQRTRKSKTSACWWTGDLQLLLFPLVRKDTIGNILCFFLLIWILPGRKLWKTLASSSKFSMWRNHVGFWERQL